MVNRKFNKPVIKMSDIPVFWMVQVKIDWNCRSCGRPQEKGAVAFEFCVRSAKKNMSKSDGAYKQAFKLFTCLPCAEQVIEETLDRVKLMKTRGPQGYEFIDTV